MDLQGRLIHSGRYALAVALLGTAVPAWSQEAGAQEAGAQEAGQPAPDTAPDNPGDLLAGNPEQGAQGGAQFPLSNAPRVYYPADFARFTPRNAFDLVDRIPGFTIDDSGSRGGGGNTARGFGEASGNVLINGERLSSKSTSVRDELSRIPVANVVRIEVVDGSLLSVPGLSGQVANVIVESAGMSGQFTWRPQLSTGPARANWWEGDVSLRGTSRGVDYTLALDSGAFVRGADGLSTFTDRFGMIDQRFNTQTAEFSKPVLSGTFAFEPAQGVAVNLNLSGGITRFRSREEETRVAGNPLPFFLERFGTRNNERFYELGADLAFPLGPGRLKLIALESFEHGNFRTFSLLDLGSQADPGDFATTGSQYDRLSDQGERIGRVEYGWAMLGGDWQWSAEAAFNRLDQLASLYAYDDGFVAIPYPQGTGGVREKRFESMLSYGTALAPGLSLQVAAGAEYSQISQTGSNALSRRFFRPKGSAALAWSAGQGLDVSLEVARRVGQLSFNDFLASVNLSSENENAGNNQLRPQQSWESELELSKTLGEWGSATLALFDHRVEDFVLIVPVQGGESRGNIASAHRQGLRFNGTLQLAPLGFTGAQLDVAVTAEKSALEDPVTFAMRRFDGNSPFEMRFDFRHDVPRTQLAWGWELRHTDSAPFYRVAEVYTDHSVASFGAIYVEHKDLLGLTVRARAGNLFNGRNILRRNVYTGPRDTAPLLLVEDRRLAIGTVFNLTVSGSF